MFEKAVRIILKWESGYSNDPNDPGGETNFGISKRSYPHIDIKNLTEKDALAIYRRDYWDTCLCDKLPMQIALVVFDCAVNQGVVAAIKILQECCGVPCDGLIGIRTLNAVISKNTQQLVCDFNFMAARMLRYAMNKNWNLYGKLDWYNFENRVFIADPENTGHENNVQIVPE